MRPCQRRNLRVVSNARRLISALTRTESAGDANLDGAVDFNDFLSLSAYFREDGTWSDGDFDLDGRIDFSDFLLLAANFGESNG